MDEAPNVWQMLDLKDKVFLVAGGARDLGRQIAEALCEAHADGLITSRDIAAARTTAQGLADKTDRRVVGIDMDATNEASVEAAVSACVEKFGRIDILVNNVGGGGAGRKGASADLEHRDVTDWQALQMLNVTAPFLLCKHISPVMRKQRSGSIINIASIAGLIGRDRRVYPKDMTPQPIDYAAAKGALIAMTRDLAASIGSHGVRVNAISPGGFERGQPHAFIDAYSDKTMLGRMGRDGVDLKGATVFLASDAAAYVTGHNLVVDGGFSVWQ